MTYHSFESSLQAPSRRESFHMIMSRMPEHQKLEPGQCRPCRNRSKRWFLRFVVFRWEWSSRSISGEAGVLLTIITCGGCRSESSVWTLDWVSHLASAMNFNLNVCNFNFRLYASRDNSQLGCKSNTWRSTSTLQRMCLDVISHPVCTELLS